MEEGPKLVRDKIPGIIENEGRTPVVRNVEGREYLEALKRKLLEEAREASECDSEQLVEEMADVFEVLMALCETQNMTMAELFEVAHEKREMKGGFEQGIILEKQN